MPGNRRRERLPFEVEVRLRFDEDLVEARTGDITMEGLFVRCAKTYAVDRMCAFEIVLTGGIEELPVRGTARVVRHQMPACEENGGMGLQFVDFEEGAPERLWHVVRHNRDAGLE